MNPLTTQFVRAGYDIEAIVRRCLPRPSPTGESYVNACGEERKVLGPPAITFRGARILAKREYTVRHVSTDIADDAELYDLVDEGRKVIVLMDFNVTEPEAAAYISALTPGILQSVPREFKFREISACGGDDDLILEFKFKP